MRDFANRNIGPSTGPIEPDQQVVLRSELKAIMAHMAQTVGKDLHNVGEALAQHHDILRSFEAAHNAVSETVESNALILQFILQKMGYMDEQGTPTPEYSAWFSTKKAEIDALRAKAEADAKESASSPLTQ